MSSGRRASAHDAVPGHPNTAEAAATANTLNYALGNLGGRRKSWMHTDQASDPPPPPAIKRKRGRPSLSSKQNAQAQPQTLPAPGLVSPATDSSRDWQPLSNSTSPQLANLAFDKNRPSPSTVLPSPSPSEETHIDSARTPQTQNENIFPTNTRVGAAATGTEMAESPREESPDIPLMELSRQRANSFSRPDKWPRLGNTQSPQARQERLATGARPNHEVSPPRVRPQSLRPSSTGQAQTQSPPLNRHLSSHAPTQQLQQAAGNRPSSRTQARTQIYPQIAGTQPQAQAPFGPPSDLSSSQPTGSSAMPSHQSPHSQAQPQRQQPPYAQADAITMIDCQNALNHFLRTVGPSPRHPRDARRLEVLADAVKKQDWDYLTLHQYFCLLDTESHSLAPTITNHPNLATALSLLGEVLDGNVHLSSPVLNFFARFPLPLSQIAINWPRTYEHQQRMFSRFMGLSVNFKSLKSACDQRGYPPLVRELYDGLGLSSMVFQQIIFTALLRRMWHKFGPSQSPTQLKFEQDAQNIFKQNQVDFLQRLSMRPPNATLEDDNVERDVEQVSWGAKLKALCQQQEQILKLLVPPQEWQPIQQANQQFPSHQSSPVVSEQPIPHILRPGTQATQAQVHRHPGRSQVHATVPSLQQPHLPSQSTTRPQSRLRRSLPSQAAVKPRPAHYPLLLPPSGWHQPQQREARPGRFALHQAGLRSPILRAQPEGTILYQHVKGFAKPPTRLVGASYGIEKWTLSISAEEFRLVPCSVSDGQGGSTSRMVNENSQLLRLRCVKWPSADLPDEHAWAVADTSWMPYTYFTFNGKSLHSRRKLHHGKDMPIDLSEFLKEGDNTLEIAVLRKPDDEKYLGYLLAIETIGFTRQKDIEETCLTASRLPAAQSINTIKNRLAKTSDDDEIAIVESNLTIDIRDPFTASRICDIPARSRSCRHPSCFDLSTFLETRTKRGDASVFDGWRCPICNGDARPQHLIVDGFLQDVRGELERRSLLETRAIIVDQNGNWKPKEEPVNTGSGQDRASPEDKPEAAAPATSTFRTTPVNVEVIDISD